MRKKNPNQVKWSNAYKNKAYETVTLFIPVGEKEKIKEHATSKGFSSYNGYIKTLILTDMGLPLDEWDKRKQDEPGE